MAEGNKKSGGLSRRQFIYGVGAVVITSAIAGLAACKPTAEEEAEEKETPTAKEEAEEKETPTAEEEAEEKETLTAEEEAEEKETPISGLIVHDPVKCVGCGVCGLMCSLYHEGAQSPALSRSELLRDPFNYDFTFNVCQQCRSPSCYFACPLKDIALCIDEVTGVRYINQDECDGCGKCIAACPLDPPRIKLHPEKNVVFNCNLCRGREEGPICVEYCTMTALTYVTKDER